jgi:chemotaxis protein methyltransferase CheR
MLGQEDLARFRALLLKRTGMAVSQPREIDLGRAVRRAVREVGAEDAASLYRRLQRGQGAEALDALVSALDVNETYFFRDADQVRALERRILPDLIASRRPQRRLRLWSAGCSTGEEAYTLAILLHNLLPDLRRWDVLILATDVNGRSLERASQGAYGEWSFRGVPPEVRARYFSRSGSRYRVASHLRDTVTFAKLNLVEDRYPSPLTNTMAMDLILCRNVLLYFDPGTARSVVGRLRDALSDDGRLLVSQVEATLDPFEGLEAVAPGAAAYQKARRPAEGGSAGWADGSGVPQSSPPPARLVLSEPELPPGHPSPGLVVEARSASGEPSAACQEAVHLWRNGHPEDALRTLDEAACSDPLAPAVHYLLGLIRLDQGLCDEALVAFRRCTYADPGFALGYVAKAGQLARVGLLAQARTALENAVGLVATLDPDDVVPHSDGLTVRQLLSLAAAHRTLIEPGPGLEVRRG